MPKVDEIAPDVFRISILEPQFNLQFNHFLIRDEEPLLFHAGYKRMFPELREAITRLLKPESIRWVSFSHFESDECGALNHWLEIAPKAQAACSFVGAVVSVNDFAIRPARGLTQDEVLATGKYAFVSAQRRIFRMAGMAACCLKKRDEHSSAPICSFTPATSNP